MLAKNSTANSPPLAIPGKGKRKMRSRVHHMLRRKYGGKRRRGERRAPAAGALRAGGGRRPCLRRDFDDACPAVAIGCTAVLDIGQPLEQPLRNRPRLAAAEGVIAAPVTEAADWRDHGAGADAERFGDAASLDVAQHVADVDAVLGHAVAEIGRE